MSITSSEAVVSPEALRVFCREITTSDTDEIINLLTKGFGGDRDRSYWTNAIARLAEHSTPTGFPKYGYMVECNGAPVGVLLLIFSSREIDGQYNIRCNGCGLYVAPAFSSYAPLLIRRAERYKTVTYFNLTPAPHTLPMVEAKGYKRLSNGSFLSVPSLRRSAPYAFTVMATPEICYDNRLHVFEKKLLIDHTGYGCVGIVCEFEGQLHPFVFAINRRYRLPLLHLIYCRDQKDFVLFAGNLGRFLRRRGFLFVALDANGSVDGLRGKYFPNRPKYWMGAEAPRLGDLPYTERVMFGY